MPELPEVETVRSGLAGRATGEILESLVVGHPGILEDCTPRDLSDLSGFRIERFDRIGKYLLVRLSKRPALRTLVVHLGMSGQFTFQAATEESVEGFVRMPSGYVKTKGPPEPDRHTHLAMGCRSGARFLFRDPRRFGRILVLDGWGYTGHPRLDRLGPDAISLSESALAVRLRERGGSRAVKAVLLDQSVLAGVGNIYADEACFEARIRPDRIASRLTGPARTRLARAVLAVLGRGIANAGTTFRDFVAADGEAGRNAEDLRVYARAGEPCLVCSRPLSGGIVATRGTVWCPHCQK